MFLVKLRLHETLQANFRENYHAHQIQSDCFREPIKFYLGELLIQFSKSTDNIFQI